MMRSAMGCWMASCCKTFASVECPVLFLLQPRPERVNQRSPPRRLRTRAIFVRHIDLRHPPLGGERLELVATEPRLDQVSCEVGVEVRLPHPQPLGIVHLQLTVGHAFG